MLIIKKIKDKKTIINVLVVLLVLFLSLAIEVLGFNYRYFLLPEKSQGILEVKNEYILLKNMEYENGNYLATGEAPSLTIKNLDYLDILRIKIGIAPNSSSFEVKTDYPETQNAGKKINIGDPLYNDMVIINIKKDVGNEIRLNFDNYNKNISDSPIEIFKIEVDNSFFFNINRFFLIFSILLLISLFAFNYKWFAEKLHLSFLIISLILGINIVFLMPTYFSFDEREHFIKAYQTASFDFGIEENMEINWPNDIEKFFSFNGKSTSFDTGEEKSNYYQLFSNNNYNNLNYYHTTAKTYLPTAYIPSAIGILIGKILALPFIYTFYLGRLFNLIMYSAVLSITIKYIKCGKRIVFALGLLPAMVYLSCSYSADPVTYVFSIASVSVFVNMYYSTKNKISFSHVLLFLICLGIMITGKMTYAPIGLLLLIVPNENFKLNKGISCNKQKTTILGVKILAEIIIGLIVVGNLKYSSYNGIAQWPIEGASVPDQITFIMNHIVLYLNICINFVLKTIPSYFEGTIGNFAYSGMFSSGIIYSVMISLFILAVIDNDGNTNNMKLWNKGYVLLCIILSWGLTITSLYLTFTPVGAQSIAGVQGRYFAPLLFPMFLLFRTNKIRNYFNKIRLNCIIIIGGVSVVAMLTIKLFINYMT